ncbi:hypothetical protein [Thalassomonas haliotis]|uniref:Uncharacterized protein n=1 Tax=Thalassomonas haliotis TaxID=485448 RepID=A0ABY7V801_9GAMM|nr:hypothetical protein [Thalassomonas haliotis]WDE09764.1 hypothetical protein H3N35_15720 [Thalassomonas haliotis]
MKKTITLLYLLIFVFTPAITSATENTRLIPGEYFLVSPEEASDAIQLRLSPDGSGKIKEHSAADIRWQKNGTATEITLLQPLVLYQFADSLTDSYRGELTSITLKPSTDSAEPSLYHYSGQLRLVHNQTGEVIDSFQENKTLELLNRKETKKWQLTLVGKEWVIDDIDLITHPEEPFFQGLSAARAAFFDNGLGIFTHHDQTISDFKWRVKGRRLIIKTLAESHKLTYIFWITEIIEDIGVKFVANVRGKAANSWRTRNGYMLMQQNSRFTPENVIGSWSRGRAQYDYYADQVHVPNIVHPASKWSISAAGTLLRNKIVHPELGPVPECPDEQCYLSCIFTRKLIAKIGDTLYFESGMDAEFYDRGPVLYQGSYILTAKYSEQMGVEQFSHNWLDYARMQLNDSDGQTSLIFAPEMAPQGTEQRLVYQDSPGNLYGHYQVLDGKLHIRQDEQVRVYELLNFNRDHIQVCRYFDGQSCEQGSQVTFSFNNNAGSLATDE